MIEKSSSGSRARWRLACLFPRDGGWPAPGKRKSKTSSLPSNARSRCARPFASSRKTTNLYLGSER